MEILMEITVKDPKWYEYLKLRPGILLQECFTVLNTKWYLDNEYSKHMTDDETLFSSFTPKKGCFVSYGDKNKGNILGFGTIDKSSGPTIGEFLLVEWLKHN